MLFRYCLLLLQAVLTALATEFDLCIQGCCGLSLKIPAEGISLSDEDGTLVTLLGTNLSCCKCSNEQPTKPSTHLESVSIVPPYVQKYLLNYCKDALSQTSSHHSPWRQQVFRNIPIYRHVKFLLSLIHI